MLTMFFSVRQRRPNHNPKPMKNIIFLSLLMMLSMPLMAQKGKIIKKSSIKALNLKIQKSKASPKFKALMDTALAADEEEDDCKPPPCTGLIDPWTCECISDIINPWPDREVAKQAQSRLNSFNQAETLASKALGGPITPEMVKKAKQIFPSRSYLGMLNRMNFYIDSVR